MGVDLVSGGRVKSTARKTPKSDNVYLLLLVKLYRFLSRRTSAGFNEVVLKRLIASRVNRALISISRVSQLMKKNEGKIAVVVGSVTDDERFLNVPKLTLAALRVTRTARARIVKAGGEVITLDQLALRAPTGANCVLLRGRKTARFAVRHFGSANTTGAVPYVNQKKSTGKRELARGRRGSKGFKTIFKAKTE